jgi:hypothetical protein
MKLKINFEYGDRIIAIKLDESLIHINTLMELVHQPANQDEEDKWCQAYDYLEDECLKAFTKQTGIDVYIDGFKQPTDKDPTGFRVSVADTLS